MMQGGGMRLKGRASRAGKPALAPDPHPHPAEVCDAVCGQVGLLTGCEVTSLSGRNCVFSNGHRHHTPPLLRSEIKTGNPQSRAAPRHRQAGSSRLAANAVAKFACGRIGMAERRFRVMAGPAG